MNMFNISTLTKAGVKPSIYSVITASLFTLTACGSMNTLPKTDKEISSDLRRLKTYCSEIPRVYSGVGYDICILNAQPKVVVIDELMLGFYALDICASALVDTVALPFTLISHSEKGPIQIASD